MPTPFHCHECDKPTMNKSGICDECKVIIKDLQSQVKWLEDGLNTMIEMINNKTSMESIKIMLMVIVEGEPTSADEYNKNLSI